MLRIIKLALAALAVVIVVLGLTIGVRTLLLESRQLAVAPVSPEPLDAEAAAQRLAASIRLQTISNLLAPEQNADQFEALRAAMKTNFPALHAALSHEVIGGHSLLYAWPGAEAKEKPILLMAHQDVVPIAPGTEADWQAPPFGGVVRDGFIWGRGAWDNKGNLFSILEAVEHLVKAEFKPRRTVYLAFGHDEEVGGVRGAKRIAAELARRGVRLDFVLDEGLLVLDGVVPGLDRPAALIGVAEKGYVTLLLESTAQPGHSSQPPARTAIGMMSAALARLEDNQFPASLRGVARDMFETLAPEMSGASRVLFANLWLFRPIVQARLQQQAATAALLRTTTAPTIFNAGNKENVLPGRAEAAVNFRLLPGDSQQTVMAHAKRLVGDGVSVKPLDFASEPSPVSSSQSESYRTLARTIREVFAGTVVAPGLMIAATDSRHFAAVADNVFRFSPVRAAPADLARFHGTNERISIANYAEMIQFYARLIRNAAGS